MKQVNIPHLGHDIVLVPRDSMRRKVKPRTLLVPSVQAVSLPDPKPSNWTMGNKLSFPILGNNKYGDCMYAAACHGSQTMTGNATAEDAFSEQAVINAYLKLSNGDNGLDMDQIMGEWLKGLAGTTHRILGDMAVDPMNTKALQIAIMLFGGVQLTVALPDAWIANPKPGDTWDAGSNIRPDPNNGHGVWVNGATAQGLIVQTWGFNPPILLTWNGLRFCDPSADVVFSLDWFNTAGMNPAGYTYDQAAAFWVALGGKPLPPSPFKPPVPIPPAPPPGPEPLPPDPAPVAGMPFDDVMGQLMLKYAESERALWVLNRVKEEGDLIQNGRKLRPLWE